MIINALPRGGRERRMLELIKGLLASGRRFEILLVSMSDQVDYEYVYDLPIRFEIIKKVKDRDIRIIFKLRKLIRSFDPAIIHSWDITASMYITMAKLFLNKPLINGFIANAPANLTLSDKRFLRVKLLAPFSKLIVANSKAGLKAYKISSKKGVVIYNGVDFTRFDHLSPEISIEENLLGRGKMNSCIATMVASFDYRKDYNTLIDAAIRLCETDRNMVFMLVGDGPGLPLVKSKVPATLLEKQIFFLGKRKDVESILRICDIGLLITNAKRHGEGISNSILEYMAAGKPIIATRGGGTDELIEDQKNGFLIDPGSPEQIVEKVDQLRSNQDLRREMGTYGYRWVRDKFSLAAMTNQFISLYDSTASYNKK